MTRPLPKHVVWITTDHMRYDCIGAHGNPAMRTPNLDRLVREGVSFDRCYVQNPLCMPSRASFMTGLYPQQTGVTANGHCLAPDFRPTVATAFSAGGFRTAQIGKLHFQPHEDHDLDPRERHSYGFDVFWLSEEAGCYEDAYMTWLRTERPDLVEVFRVPRSCSPDRSRERDGRVLDAPWQYSHSGWIATQAERFLKGRAALGGVGPRHFMHLGFYAPHPPLNPTEEMFAPYRGAALPAPHLARDEWRDKPEPLAGMLRMCDGWSDERLVEYRRHFYAMVTGVDLAVGRVLAALEHEGALDDTLIVFSSDHGDMCGDHRMILKGTSYYEELMRQPCVLFWPNGLGREGRRVAGLVEMVDLLPTLLGLSGCAIPEVMVGRNHAEALLSRAAISPRESVFAYHEPGSAMVRTATHKYIRYGPEREVLFDLEADPRETANLAGRDAKTLGAMREIMLQRLLEASRSPQPRLYRY